MVGSGFSWGLHRRRTLQHLFFNLPAGRQGHLLSKQFFTDPSVPNFREKRSYLSFRREKPFHRLRKSQQALFITKSLIDFEAKFNSKIFVQKKHLLGRRFLYSIKNLL